MTLYDWAMFLAYGNLVYKVARADAALVRAYLYIRLLIEKDLK